MAEPMGALTLSTPALQDHTVLIVSIRVVNGHELGVSEREISPSDHSTFALEDVLSWVPSEGNQKAKCLSYCHHSQSIDEEILI